MFDAAYLIAPQNYLSFSSSLLASGLSITQMNMKKITYYLEFPKGLTYRREMLDLLFKRFSATDNTKQQPDFNYSVKSHAEVDQSSKYWRLLYDVYSEEHELMADEYLDQQLVNLPHDWLVLSLSYNADLDTLWISGYMHEESIFCYKYSQEDTSRILDMVFDVKSIIERNNKLSHEGIRCETKADKMKWWDERKKLDLELSENLKLIDRLTFARFLAKTNKKFAHIVLIVDKLLLHYPWESTPSLRAQSVSRVPCLSFLRDRLLDWKEEEPEMMTMTDNRVSFILNPSKDLSSTEKTLQTYLKKTPIHKSITYRCPSETEWTDMISTSDIFL
jgi:hypothetical protein